jgi:hypothetical protein
VLSYFLVPQRGLERSPFVLFGCQKRGLARNGTETGDFKMDESRMEGDASGSYTGDRGHLFLSCRTLGVWELSPEIMAIINNKRHQAG